MLNEASKPGLPVSSLLSLFSRPLTLGPSGERSDYLQLQPGQEELCSEEAKRSAMLSTVGEKKHFSSKIWQEVDTSDLIYSLQNSEGCDPFCCCMQVVGWRRGRLCGRVITDCIY